MFRKSGKEQLNMFKEVSSLMSVSAQKKLDDKTGWHQVFYEEFVSRVDEGIYSVLFSQKMGRPNASIRILLGMMVLKEMNGWSDEQLMDECMFNLRVRASLGIYHIDATAPVAATYYEFRSRIAQHLEMTGADLVEQTFAQVCTKQIERLQISGSKIRMDSKLIQSNIAKQNRLQMIMEALRVSIRDMDIESFESILSTKQLELLETLKNKSTTNVTYQLDHAEKKEMLNTVGQIIHCLIHAGQISQTSILYRIYTEQYDPPEDDDQEGPHQVKPKSPQQIGSNSIQSIHDTQAAYRKKGKGEHVQIVQGYHSNITETCGQKERPNLIIDVITTPANISECEYFEASIDRSNEKLLTGNTVEEVITDGGYDSKSNRASLQESSSPSWKLQKLKGRKRAYQMQCNEQGEIEVKDKRTDKQLEVKWSPRVQKYRIKNHNGTYRYFTKAEVQDYIYALQILENGSQTDYNLRCSVESTIHEVFHRLERRYKIKYRGSIKCHWYALLRATSVNLGRIQRYYAGKVLEKAILLLTFFLHRHSTLHTRKEAF